MKPRGMNLGGTIVPPQLVGVMILIDRSGSMQGIKHSMESELEAFIQDQRATNPDGMWLSVHQFDSVNSESLDYEVTCDRRPIAEVEPITIKPNGGTPLRDALWEFGHAARTIVNDAANVTERLLLVIITDGRENASRLHQWSEVKELLQGLAGADCEIIWMGTTAAITEAQAEVPMMAMAGATFDYAPTAVGTAYMGAGLRAMASSYRVGKSAVSASASFQDSYSPGGDLSPLTTSKATGKAKKPKKTK